VGLENGALELKRCEHKQNIEKPLQMGFVLGSRFYKMTLSLNGAVRGGWKGDGEKGGRFIQVGVETRISQITNHFGACAPKNHRPSSCHGNKDTTS
jgi:hypothetical protein